MFFHWWYRRLCRYVALREANRHHLMYFLVAVRRLMLRMGTLLVAKDRLAVTEDIFFLTMKDLRSLADEPEKDWRPQVKARRQEWERNARVTVPDYLPAGMADWAMDTDVVDDSDELRGVPISPGLAKGTVRIARSQGELNKVQPGDILVLSVLDPGLAPYFGVIGGVIAEMGGTLSHGALIAREYGVPAVANVARATHVLKDGQTVLLDASKGLVHRVTDSDSTR